MLSNESETKLMHKVLYLKKDSKEQEMALFSDKEEACMFEEYLSKTKNYIYISLNKWPWLVEIED